MATTVNEDKTMRTMEDYETLFDPNVYLKEYFANFDGNQTDFSGTNEDWDYLPSSMQFWFETFSKTNFPGDSMLDVGTGPNLIPSIFASRRFKNIYLSDYAEVNLKALRQWIDRSPEAWDWTPFYKYVAMKVFYWFIDSLTIAWTVYWSIR